MSAFLLNNPDCVLVHIPKSAGSSIRMGVWEGQYEGPYYGALPDELKKYFCFAFARNPFDRLVSVWKMFSVGAKNTGGYQYNWKPDPSLTLKDVLDITIDENILYDERRSNFEEILKHHSIPMLHPFNGIDDADFVGRVESIDADWEYICRRIGIDDVALPRLNFTSNNRETGAKEYRKYFNAELRRRAEVIYAEDIERFGYEF